MGGPGASVLACRCGEWTAPLVSIERKIELKCSHGNGVMVSHSRRRDGLSFGSLWSLRGNECILVALLCSDELKDQCASEMNAKSNGLSPYILSATVRTSLVCWGYLRSGRI